MNETKSIGTNMNLQIGIAQGKHTKKEITASLKKMSELWQAGKKEDALEILNGIFGEGIFDADLFFPYAKQFGKEFRDLISKLYLIHSGGEDDGPIWNLFEFEDSCGEGLVSGIASTLAGEKWEKIRELFYEKCPGCMFMGDTEEPYSLKLRSENCIECIPADDSDLHELADPLKDYSHAMDGYSFFEGHALVKDDPEAKENYPAEIRNILKKIKARKLKYFPNVIFPLVEGKNLFDSFRQMTELLQLLDHGYHFESISRYITDHPELFPDITKKRIGMFKTKSDSEDDDIELDFDDIDETIIELEEEETEPESKYAVPEKNKAQPETRVLPELDLKRIQEDQARGIEFSSDKRILVKYPEKLKTAEYEVPTGVISIKKNAFSECKQLKKVKIPEGVLSIGDKAFKKCSKLKKVVIPKSVKHIGSAAFAECPCEPELKKKYPELFS